MFVTDAALEPELMQALTVELRQFETIFLTPTHDLRRFRARIFAMEEELDFAGHPVLGAAAVLHEARNAGGEAVWTIALSGQDVTVESRKTAVGYETIMHQASPAFGPPIVSGEVGRFLTAFGLRAADRDSALPMQMVTTGLPYLIIPVTAAGLEHGRIQVDNLETRLGSVGAKFVYLLDARGREGRTWDNFGRVEDIATGSAAGPAAGYLVKHGLAQADEEIIIRQGRFVGRPSDMRLRVSDGGVLLTGDVRMIASGEFDSLA